MERRKITLFYFTLSLIIIRSVTQINPAFAEQDPATLYFGCTEENLVIYYTNPPMVSFEVQELEERLLELGYNPGILDGKYDLTAENAVKKFQADEGLMADGRVGSDTWSALAKGTDKAVGGKSTPPPKGQIKILINIDKCTLTILADGAIYKEYPVAIGKSKTPSPIGEWKVINKSAGWGGGFGTRWLGLNVPWGIYGIHGTNKPWSIGRSASHGCFRMFNRDVEEIYPWIKYGTPIVVIGSSLVNTKIRELKPGYSGPDVVAMQFKLKESGLLWGPADGRYGKTTEMALKYFQTLNGLENNGLLGKETKKTLGL